LDDEGIDVAPLKEIQKFMWSLGDYSKIARISEAAAEALAQACGLGPGVEVLDVAAGNGNFAVVAARLGARVVASDITPRMIEMGRERCEAEGLEVEWREADAEDLPFEDDRFDCCASMFGSMFAPRPDVVTSEMFRVTRPGGSVAMTNWTPDGFIGKMLAGAMSYAPPPPEGIPSPLAWGDPATVRDRLAASAESIGIERGMVHLDFDSVEEGQAFAEQNLGPMVALRTILPPDRFQALSGETMRLAAAFNQDQGGRLVIDSEYLEVVAHKA